MKSAEILRPLTFARNYATIACRKSKPRRKKCRKRTKSFPVVKRSEILRFLLIFFCKVLKNGRRKSGTWKTKVPHVNLRDGEQRKHAPKSNGKNKAHKARGRESAENAEAVQRAFPRPPAPFLFMFFTCVQRACACLRRGAAEPHLFQDKHTPYRQKLFS